MNFFANIYSGLMEYFTNLFSGLMDFFTSNSDDFNWPLCYFVISTGVIVYFVQACVENKMRPAFIGLFMIAVVIIGTGQQEAMMNTQMRRVLAATTLVLVTNAVTAIIGTLFR